MREEGLVMRAYFAICILAFLSFSFAIRQNRGSNAVEWNRVCLRLKPVSLLKVYDVAVEFSSTENVHAIQIRVRDFGVSRVKRDPRHPFLVGDYKATMTNHLTVKTT